MSLEIRTLPFTGTIESGKNRHHKMLFPGEPYRAAIASQMAP